MPMSEKGRYNCRKTLADLTVLDINEWAGSKIVSRGRSYQQEGLVSELVITSDGNLIAWVTGSVRYATRVGMGKGDLPDSFCSCPYQRNCKHGVAVVFEYLKRIKNNQDVPQGEPDDPRMEMLNETEEDLESASARKPGSRDLHAEIDAFLQGLNKSNLVNLIHEMSRLYPDLACNLADRFRLQKGDIKSLVTRLRQEIHATGEQPGWSSHWNDDGFTPDYSGIRRKLDTLIDAGFADEALSIGKELMKSGMNQVGMSQDDGQTAEEIEECMPVIIKALQQSSLPPADKLYWALDVLLADEYDLCGSFDKFLQLKHPPAAWNELADRLLVRLDELKDEPKNNGYGYSSIRRTLVDYIIHALNRCGRRKEVIPLCEMEAEKAGDYGRLVGRLIALKRYRDAERWIWKGLHACKQGEAGTAHSLREWMIKLLTLEKRWPEVAAIQCEEFVRYPSWQTFTDCRGTCFKNGTWTVVRECLLNFLENGHRPWEQNGWPLPASALEPPETERREKFPRLIDLIDIAINENKPDQVLRWYDCLSRKTSDRFRVDDDEIATAIQKHAPERAVAIWIKMAEAQIALTKPSAYQQAARCLQKAGKVMSRLNKRAQWRQYLETLRTNNIRKVRLVEILDGLMGRSIVGEKRH
jgi:uncharacterized Zn finger protein